MLALLRLIFIGIILHMFINLFLDNFYNNRSNAITYKIYIFLFIFILNFLFQLFTNLVIEKKISVSQIIQTSINYALIAVIAYDVYNDLNYNNFFDSYKNPQHHVLILVLLIIGFIAAIKIIELLLIH